MQQLYSQTFSSPPACPQKSSRKPRANVVTNPNISTCNNYTHKHSSPACPQQSSEDPKESFCSNCGYERNERGNFCSNCGCHRHHCASCGHEHESSFSARGLMFSPALPSHCRMGLPVRLLAHTHTHTIGGESADTPRTPRFTRMLRRPAGSRTMSQSGLTVQAGTCWRKWC